LVGRSSDARGRPDLHLAGAAAVAAVGLAGSAFIPGPAVLLPLCLATAGIYAMLGPFWSLPPAFLGGVAAAGGIALINSVGNLAGFAGPYLLGLARQHTGSFSGGLIGLAITLLVLA